MASKWHTNCTVGDLHYLRSKFALERGSNAIYLKGFVMASEQLYNTRQFRIDDSGHFLTWAFLTPEWEVDHITGGMNWINHLSEGAPWIVEANMPSLALSAMRELRPLIPGKILRFRRGFASVGSVRLP